MLGAYSQVPIIPCLVLILKFIFIIIFFCSFFYFQPPLRILCCVKLLFIKSQIFNIILVSFIPEKKLYALNVDVMYFMIVFLMQLVGNHVPCQGSLLSTSSNGTSSIDNIGFKITGCIYKLPIKKGLLVRTHTQFFGSLVNSIVFVKHKLIIAAETAQEKYQGPLGISYYWLMEPSLNVIFCHGCKINKKVFTE